MTTPLPASTSSGSSSGSSLRQLERSFLGAASGSSSGSSSGSPADSGLDAAYASCASPGKATAGTYNNHCATQNPDDGGVLSTVDEPGQLHAGRRRTDNGDAAPQCAYGDTMYGRVGIGVDGGAVAGAIEGDDDDCKYHVSWTSTPICEGSGGVEFTVTAIKQTDGTPVTGGMYMMEAFTTTPADAGTVPGCDDSSLHPSPTTDASMTETAAGTGVYKVNMVVRQAGPMDHSLSLPRGVRGHPGAIRRTDMRHSTSPSRDRRSPRGVAR